MAVPGDASISLDVRTRPVVDGNEYEIIFSATAKNVSSTTYHAYFVFSLWRDSTLVKGDLRASEHEYLPGQIRTIGPNSLTVVEPGSYHVKAEFREYPSDALLAEVWKTNVLTLVAAPVEAPPVEAPPVTTPPVEAPTPTGGAPLGLLLGIGAALGLGLLLVGGRRRR